MDEYIKKSDVLEYLSLRRNQVLKSPLSTLDAKFEVMEIFDFVDHRVESADVATVRHGRWEWCKDYDGDSILVCSECSEPVSYYPNIRDVREENHYCPNCGAIMDLEG